jgi:hypothetical protein
VSKLVVKTEYNADWQPLLKYCWELQTDDGKYLGSGYSGTVRGAKWAARRKLKKLPKERKFVEKIVYEGKP